MTSDSEGEISRHGSPPMLHHPRVRVLIKRVIYLHKIKDSRVSLKRRLPGNREVSPTACSNKIVCQQLHSLRAYFTNRLISFYLHSCVHFHSTLSTFQRCRSGDSLKRQKDAFFISSRRGRVRVLSQNALVKSLPSRALLTLNIPNIDELFPGFATGDFALLCGTSAVLPLSSLLCARAQLPNQLRGLGTDVIFVDGGNTFRLYQVSRIAQIHQLDPRQVLKCIYISRAFTAHQLTSIVFERLKDTVDKFNSKLVVISDIAGLYLDKDVPAEEAKRVFSQLTAFLSTFAEENQLILIATYPPHHCSRRNSFLHALACGRANVVISIRPSKYGQEFVLEKHSHFTLGHAEFPSENLTLNDFIGGC